MAGGRASAIGRALPDGEDGGDPTRGARCCAATCMSLAHMECAAEQGVSTTWTAAWSWRASLGGRACSLSVCLLRGWWSPLRRALGRWRWSVYCSGQPRGPPSRQPAARCAPTPACRCADVGPPTLKQCDAAHQGAGPTMLVRANGVQIMRPARRDTIIWPVASITSPPSRLGRAGG